MRYVTKDIPEKTTHYVKLPPAKLGDRYTSYVYEPIVIEVVKLSVFKRWLSKALSK